MSCPLENLIAASAPRGVLSVVLDPGAGGAFFYDGETISLPAPIIVIERPEELSRGLLQHTSNEFACICKNHSYNTIGSLTQKTYYGAKIKLLLAVRLKLLCSEKNVVEGFQFQQKHCGYLLLLK